MVPSKVAEGLNMIPGLGTFIIITESAESAKDSTGRKMRKIGFRCGGHSSGNHRQQITMKMTSRREKGIGLTDYVEKA